MLYYVLCSIIIEPEYWIRFSARMPNIYTEIKFIVMTGSTTRRFQGTCRYLLPGVSYLVLDRWSESKSLVLVRRCHYTLPDKVTSLFITSPISYYCSYATVGILQLLPILCQMFLKLPKRISVNLKSIQT